MQVGGYMRSDSLQLPCVQPLTSSYNFQLPHGCNGHHDRHGHGGHGKHDDHYGRESLIQL